MLFRIFFLFILSAIATAQAHGAIVYGYCELECKNKHCCTRVEIDDSIIHPPVHTDSSGYYSWLAIVPGWHKFSYSHVGYYPETHDFYVPFLGGQLPDVTLETKALCDPCSWLHYPYTIPGTPITLPYDEGKHDPTSTYRIEWWYVNFHLTDEDGKEYGAIVSFFKPPVIGSPGMVLMSIIDLKQGIIYQKAKYPLLCNASEQFLDLEFGAPPTDKWYNNKCNGDLVPFEYHMEMSWVDNGSVWLDLDMACLKPPMPVGGDGYVEFDNIGWSYYYSHPRVDVLGTIYIPGFPLLGKDVKGYAWIDHQWADWPEEKVKWEWISIQLDDDREIMVGDFWIDDERKGSYSDGLNYYDENCTLDIIPYEDYTMTRLDSWTDPVSGKTFSTKWKVQARELSKKKIDLIVAADFDHQIMNLTPGHILPICFWEGACTVSGTIDGQSVKGTAYAEVTISRPDPLSADVDQIPESGGIANFTLTAGKENALRDYILLGSVSGTEPGIPLPGNLVTLPLKWDFFTGFILSTLPNPIFGNFMGTLNSEGSGIAQLNLPPVPGAAGFIMYFAYALDPPPDWDFVSNPVAIEIVP